MSLRGLLAAVVLAFVAAGCSCGPGTGECSGGSTRPCPLTLGVCAGSVSTCLDGHWSTCDYGPDYQLTERRCDGLDNDCDGTVDSSWTRTLLDADAGRFGALRGFEVEFAKVVPGSDGHWLSLPEDLVIIDDELRTTGRTRFPSLLNGRAYLFPNGTEWLRLANDSPATGAPARLLFHRVFADAGFEVASDGGLRLLAEHVLPSWFGGFRAAAVDGGWVAVAKAFNQQDSVQAWDCQWARLDVDGGLTHGTFDAGGVPSVWQAWFSAHGATMILWGQTHSGTLEIFDVDLASSSLRPRLSVSGTCWVATVVPLTVSCEPSPRRWLDEAGTVLLSSPTWEAASQHEDGDHLLGRAVSEGGDGSEHPPGFRFGELRDGGIVPFVEIGDSPIGTYLRINELGGRLVLVTWGDRWGTGVCPDCEIGNFVARYACLPP